MSPGFEIHHTLDCNESAIYNGGKCTCRYNCGSKKTGLWKRDKKVTHWCGSPSSKHDGPHRCDCGEKWED